MAGRGAGGARGALGRALLVGGVAVAVLALVASIVAFSGDDPSGTGGAADVPVSGGAGSLGGIGGVPERIQPTSEPSPGEPGAVAPAPSGTLGVPGDGGAATPGTRPPSGTAHPEYSAWAGPGCTGGGQYKEHGRYADGFEGWYTVRTGGHRGDGCDGRFSAIPMSGSESKDNGNTATWSWYVGSGYTTCSLAVVVPKAPRPQDVAGEPSVYRVLADPADDDSLIKTFEVNQTQLRGRGAVIQKIPVRGQRLTVRLVDRGRDWGGDREGAHHAAAQMRADCRP
ncbi:adhesin [Streptomyces sp. NPDC004609]|uniref:adhesin n=1 Tax=Streptomyces sp. NPDC004609 TaxID=3364704 RepID=UPI00369EE7A6